MRPSDAHAAFHPPHPPPRPDGPRDDTATGPCEAAADADAASSGPSSSFSDASVNMGVAADAAQPPAPSPAPDLPPAFPPAGPGVEDAVLCFTVPGVAPSPANLADAPLFGRTALSDVEVVAGATGRAFAAHRAVLALHSDFFRAVFTTTNCKMVLEGGGVVERGGGTVQYQRADHPCGEEARIKRLTTPLYA